MQARLEACKANIDAAYAHKMRTSKLSKTKPDALAELDYITAFAIKDYMGKLEARKVNQV